MTIQFKKYQGTGNDFVIIDNREGQFSNLDKSTIAKICDRRFGVGADGLMLLEKAQGYDFKMVYYNADGAESTMCGNGGRCLVKFAHDIGHVGMHTTFIAVDGPHEASISNGLVSLKMIDVAEADVLGGNQYFLNTGSPHVVKFVQDIHNHAVYEEGKNIRYSKEFAPGGTNVNFVQDHKEHIFVRTYERGVENETLSCGTGVTAAALASTIIGKTSPVAIKTLGGDLKVSFAKNNSKFEMVYLIGPAQFVFDGQIAI